MNYKCRWHEAFGWLPCVTHTTGSQPSIIFAFRMSGLLLWGSSWASDKNWIWLRLPTRAEHADMILFAPSVCFSCSAVFAGTNKSFWKHFQDYKCDLSHKNMSMKLEQIQLNLGILTFCWTFSAHFVLWITEASALKVGAAINMLPYQQDFWWGGQTPVWCVLLGSPATPTITFVTSV